MRAGLLAVAAAACSLVALSGGAVAGPWTSVADAQLRSDVELLASAGAIDNIAMQWPLPWAGLLDRLEPSGALSGQPDYIRAAASRIIQDGKLATKSGLHADVTVDAASSPAFIRGFDALGRQTLQGQATVEYVWKTTVLHLSLGAQSADKFDHQAFVPDGSYIAQRLGDTVIYAGYMNHWWGPGWISALQLSTNARPIPQVGFSRLSTAPFRAPILRWLGPWQFEFFAGVLDGPRVARNTIYSGMRFDFSPIPHLEIGLSRTDQMCGTGHPCKPLVGYFNLDNQDNAVNIVNDEGSIDIRYTGVVKGLNYAIYTQFMNEDSSPIVHSGTSHLVGASAWLPMSGGIGRLTIEYADSVATRDIWGSGTMPGVAYNNGGYSDGMRYRDRTLGFSLDSDSRLLSVQANYMTPSRRSYTLTFHHAEVSTPTNLSGNVVTAAPVIINMGQARISFPLEVNDRHLRFDIEGRVQDDQPRPHRGYLASIEAALTIGL